MSELKAYDFPVDHGDFTTTIELFYLKSEADKVISELKHHRVGAFRLANMGLTLTHIAEKEIDRQKYKRCLDKATICSRNIDLCICDTPDWPRGNVPFWQKWRERWLELAAKLKENL